MNDYFSLNYRSFIKLYAMKILFIKILPAILLMIAIVPGNSQAQKNGTTDEGYYIAYPEKVMVRLYLSQKFAPFTVSSQGDKELNYKTNSKLTLGVGASYKSFTLNLGYGFKFLNKDKGQGKTKGLDLQVHIFPNKWAVDVLGTFIKGYYLDPKDNNGLNLSTFYQRPDIHRNVIGFTVFRVPNSNKFSYKAAVTQSVWQVKSAGSVLYGGEIYYGSITGDSAIVPSKVASVYPQSGLTKVNFISVGPGIGYAYTLVFNRNYFISGSVIANGDLNFSSEQKGGTKLSKVNFTPSGIFKGAIGYNSDTWSVSANILGNALYSGSAVSSKEYFLPTGTIRFIVAKKIGVKK